MTTESILDLGPWGAFRARDIEAEYRLHDLEPDGRLAAIIIGIAQLGIVLLVNDYRFFGLTGRSMLSCWVGVSLSRA